MEFLSALVWVAFWVVFVVYFSDHIQRILGLIERILTAKADQMILRNNPPEKVASTEKLGE